MILTDTDPMPFGIHKGKPMQDVPVQYLHWLYHNGLYGQNGMAIKHYVEQQINALKLENKDLIWTIK
jgi:uncharacterized protein (DUF3820 family)